MLEVIVDGSGKQLLLEELSSDLQRKLNDLKKRRDRMCTRCKKKNSKYMCQRCGNVDRRLFASFLCKRCSKVCTYCRKCITMGRVSECAVLVRGIAERKREKIQICYSGTGRCLLARIWRRKEL